MKRLLKGVSVGLLGCALMFSALTSSADRSVKVLGWGAQSGPLKSFGVNSEIALRSAVAEINTAGGVKLGDGTMVPIEVIGYKDSACRKDQNIAILRKTASTTDAIVGMGTTCSGSCQAMFGVLQKKVGDASDSGLQMPILADTCIRPGLAKISEWAFRNVPNEIYMYDAFFAWLSQQYPGIKTFSGGTETDQGHSFITHTAVIVQAAIKHGFEWVGPAVPELGPKVKQGMKELQAAAKSQHWLMGDTNYSVQARKIKKQNPDMVLVSSHPFSACGFLKEMKRQRAKPKLLVGLTSSASQETLNGCMKEAEGIIIPTGFAPITAEAQKANAIVAGAGGFLDLHSAAAWENAFLVKAAVEAAGITAKPETLAEDRAKFRDALATITASDGLIGPVTRDTASGEASKPFVYVQVVDGKWEVIHDPRGKIISNQEFTNESLNPPATASSSASTTSTTTQAAQTTTAQPSAVDNTAEIEFWKSIKDQKNADMYQAYIDQFPDGVYVALAKIKLKALGGDTSTVAQSSIPNLDYGDYYALVIGNNRYEYLGNLRTAVNDARSVANLLELDYGFKVTKLENANRDQIISSISGLRSKVTSEDNVLIYYAGHGVLDKDADEGYWLPVDASRDNPANWVMTDQVVSQIRAMKAKHVMIVADSCFSGKITRGLKIEQRTPEWLETIVKKKARTALTSGGLEPVMDSGGGNNSVFANSFLSILRENDGVLDASQLFSQLRPKVMVNSDQTPEYGDIHRAGHDGGDFLFVRRER